MSERFYAIAKADTVPSFVVDQWLSAYRKSPWAGCVPNNVFNAVYTEAIRQLFQRGAQLWVAHNPSRPDHVLAFMVCEITRDGVPVVHFAFTKDLWRRKGMQRDLFAAAGIDPKSKFFYTFKTGQEKHFPGGRYAPAVARRKDA